MILDHFTARNEKTAKNNGSNDLFMAGQNRSGSFESAMNQMHGSAAIYAASSDQDRVCLPCPSRQGWMCCPAVAGWPRRVEHGAIDRQSGDGVADRPEDARIIGGRAPP